MGIPNLSVASKSVSSCSNSPVSGAPVSSFRPIVNSFPPRSNTSQVSISIAIRRSTSVDPPSEFHTRSSKSTAGSGLTVPSTCPIKFRMVVPDG